jgi:hypothetical protein
MWETGHGLRRASITLLVCESCLLMTVAHHLHGVSNDPLFCVIYCSSSFMCYEPVFFCTKPVLAIWLFSNMCIHSFKDLSIYLSIYLSIRKKWFCV